MKVLLMANKKRRGEKEKWLLAQNGNKTSGKESLNWPGHYSSLIDRAQDSQIPRGATHNTTYPGGSCLSLKRFKTRGRSPNCFVARQNNHITSESEIARTQFGRKFFNQFRK